MWEEAIHDSSQLSPHGPCRGLGHLDQLKRNGRDLCAHTPGQWDPALVFSTPTHRHNGTHATRRYLSFRRTVVCCVCGVSRWWWGGGSFSSPVIGPETITKPLKKKPTDLKTQLLPLLHLTSKAVIGFQRSFSARDHLTRAVFLNLSAPGRDGGGGDDLKKSRPLSIYKSGNLIRYTGAVLVNASSLWIGSQLRGLTQPPPSRPSQPTKSYCPCIPSTWTHGKGKQALPAWQVIIVSSFTPLPLPLPPHTCSQPIPRHQLGRSNPPQDPDSPRRASPPCPLRTPSLPRYPSEARAGLPASRPLVLSLGSHEAWHTLPSHLPPARPAGHTEWAGYIFAGSHSSRPVREILGWKDGARRWKKRKQASKTKKRRESHPA